MPRSGRWARRSSNSVSRLRWCARAGRCRRERRRCEAGRAHGCDSCALTGDEHRGAPGTAAKPRRPRIRRAELHHPDWRAAERSFVRSALGSPQYRPGHQLLSRHRRRRHRCGARLGSDGRFDRARRRRDRHRHRLHASGSRRQHLVGPGAVHGQRRRPAITCAAGSTASTPFPACNPMDDHHHGTHSQAPSAPRATGSGLAGVNWVRMMGIKFIDDYRERTIADAIAALELRFAVKQAFAATGAAISACCRTAGAIRILTGAARRNHGPQRVRHAVCRRRRNSGFETTSCRCTHPPASRSERDLGRATSNTDARACSRTTGAESVHLAAPGFDILPRCPRHLLVLAARRWRRPHVSGAAALVLSVCDLDTRA